MRKSALPLVRHSPSFSSAAPAAVAEATATATFVVSNLSAVRRLGSRTSADTHTTADTNKATLIRQTQKSRSLPFFLLVLYLSPQDSIRQRSTLLPLEMCQLSLEKGGRNVRLSYIFTLSAGVARGVWFFFRAEMLSFFLFYFFHLRGVEAAALSFGDFSRERRRREEGSRSSCASAAPRSKQRIS